MTSRSLTITLNLIALAATAALFASCSSSTSPTSALNGSNGTASFTTVYSEILQPQCMNCHQPSGSAWADNVHLDFRTQGAAYSSLNPGSTRVSATDAVGTCGSVYLISAGSASASYIIPTLSVSQSNDFVQTGCTPYQHNSVALSAAELSDLTSWINTGAPNN